MKPTSLLATLAVLTLAPAVAAQASFDLILPDEFRLRDEVGSPQSLHVGMIVNTGTEPIQLQQWQYAHSHARSSESLEWNQFVPSWSGSASFTLLPGEATGVDDPAYHALLGPSEAYVPGAYGALFVWVDGVEGQSPTVTVHVELGDQRVRAELAPTFGTPTDPQIQLQTVRRWSSQTVTPSVRTTAEACVLPGVGALPLVQSGSSESLGGEVGRFSDLPFLGNDRFLLQMGQLMSPSYVGTPWVLFLETPGTTYDVLGCELVGVLHPLTTGTVKMGSGFAFVPAVPLPIPNNANLVGKTAALQMVFVTPQASNGLFAASTGVELTFGDPLLP